MWCDTTLLSQQLGVCRLLRAMYGTTDIRPPGGRAPDRLAAAAAAVLGLSSPLASILAAGDARRTACCVARAPRRPVLTNVFNNPVITTTITICVDSWKSQQSCLSFPFLFPLYFLFSLPLLSFSWYSFLLLSPFYYPRLFPPLNPAKMLYFTPRCKKWFI